METLRDRFKPRRPAGFRGGKPLRFCYSFATATLRTVAKCWEMLGNGEDAPDERFGVTKCLSTNGSVDFFCCRRWESNPHPG